MAATNDDIVNSLASLMTASERNTNSIVDALSLISGGNGTGGGGGGRRDIDNFRRQLRQAGGELENIDDILEDTADNMSLFSTSAKNAGKNLAKASGDVAGGLMDSKQSFTSFQPIIKMVADQLGKMAEAAGEAASAIPFIGGLSTAAGKAGAAIITAGAAFSGFALGQLQKYTDTMRTLQAQGVQFAGGLTEMGEKANETGLLLTQFQTFTKKANAELVLLGGSVSNGVTTFNTWMRSSIGATKAEQAASIKLREERELELRSLGYSFEEARETQAEYLAMVQRTGQLQYMSQEEVRTGAQQYAKNLKLLSSFTGEEVDAIQKKQQEAMRSAAVRASLDELAEQNITGVTDNFKQLTTVAAQFGPLGQKVIDEVLSRGRLVSDDTLQFARTNASLVKWLTDQTLQIKQGANPKAYSDAMFSSYKAATEGFAADVKGNRWIAQLATIPGAAQEGIIKTVQDTYTFTSDAVRKQVALDNTKLSADIEGAAKGLDKTTQQVNKASQSLQNAAEQLQELGQKTLGVGGTLVEISSKSIEFVAEQLNNLGTILEKMNGVNNPDSSSTSSARRTAKVVDELGAVDASGNPIGRQIYDPTTSGLNPFRGSTSERYGKFGDLISSDKKIDDEEKQHLKTNIEELKKEIADLRTDASKQRGFERNRTNKEIEDSNAVLETLQELLKEAKKTSSNTADVASKPD